MDATEALLKLAINIVTLGLTWVVGQRVISYWTARNKRKELQLQLTADFYKSYGQFRSVWKHWNDTLTLAAEAQSDAPTDCSDFLKRALEAEGEMEAVLLKVASERKLDEDPDQKNLGNLRQAFQVLHERIRSGVPVSYGSCDDLDYLEFKRLSTWFGTLLASASEWEPPSADDAFKAFEEITDNRYEKRWRAAGQPQKG